MIRRFVVSSALVLGLLCVYGLAASDAEVHAQGQASAQVSPADAAPFIGDWTLNLEGPNGPGTFGVSLKVEKEKVVGEITNEAMPPQTFTDISMQKETLRLGYSFTWEGNPVDAVVSLTPEKEGKVTAQIDFANGAYIMSGTAAKKAASSK